MSSEYLYLNTNEYLISVGVIRFKVAFWLIQQFKQIWQISFLPKNRDVVAFQVEREKKHLKKEIVLWCQQGASFNFFSSFFKLILQGYTAWARSDLLPEIPLISLDKRAYQPHRVFWYLIATPWCCCTPPSSLQNCFTTLQMGSTGMGEWTDDCLRLRKI